MQSSNLRCKQIYIYVSFFLGAWVGIEMELGEDGGVALKELQCICPLSTHELDCTCVGGEGGALNSNIQDS